MAGTDNAAAGAREERLELGTVSPEERDEIQAIFERKNGLTELFKSMTVMSRQELEGNALYDKLVADMGDITTRFKKWWEVTSRRYGWQGRDGYRWEINFDTCVVTLRKQ